MFLWVASVGRHADQWQLDEHQHVAAMRADRKRWVIEAAVARLREHLQQGDRVIVVTGAFESLARSIVNEVLECDSVEVLGSRGRWLRAALRMDEHCFARQKLRRLAAEGVSLPVDAAYSDSLHDLPLLASARRPCLIGGPASLAAAIRRRLPHLEWITEAGATPR